MAIVGIRIGAKKMARVIQKGGARRLFIHLVKNEGGGRGKSRVGEWRK